MYLSNRASRIREKEAQNARADRAEIIRALSVGEISRGDFFRWGIFTAGGLLVCKSPFASSAFAQVLTGTPRSPLFVGRSSTSPCRASICSTPSR